MQTLKFYLSFITALLLLHPLNAQISQGGTPYSFTHSVGDSIPTITLQSVNVDSLLQADAADTSLHPFRFGYAHQVDITTDNSGIWETLPDSSRLWRLGITSPGAYALNLLYDDYYLLPGMDLFIYNADTTTLLGAFTAVNNKTYRKFSTAQVMGDFITLELYIPFGAGASYSMHLDEVVHDYTDFFSNRDGGGDRSAWCEINIACEGSSIWQDAKRSVVLILAGNSYCSGALINQTALADPSDPSQYDQLLMTASHCFLGGYDPGSWIFYFNYESESCDPTSAGSLNQTVTGAESLVYEHPNNSTDISLLTITADIPESFNAYYAGWNRNQYYGLNTVCIHHPMAEVKKIAYDNNQPGDFNDYKYLINFDEGDVEHGSSGAPLFDVDGAIIGQVHAGAGNDHFCADDHDVIFGKLYQSWDDLSQYLDPAGLNPIYLEGSNPGCTDPSAFNYDPVVSNDNGSCYGQKGDINLDECVNVSDVVLLVDFILNPGTANEYEFWAGNLAASLPPEEEQLDTQDLTALVDLILNNPSCTGGAPRTVGNSFLTLTYNRSLSRRDGDITEIVLTNETDVRAAHFEFLFPNIEISDVYMADEFSDLSIRWVMREDTLAILFYGAEGQSIPQGSHLVAIVEFDDQLDRGDNQNIEYINGNYADNTSQLYSIQLRDHTQQTNIIPERFALHQPYPNPFNPVTTIGYDLAVDAVVNISIYNLNGGLVKELMSGFEYAGSYEIRWETKNLSSGLYFIRLNTDNYVETRKVLLLK